MCCHEVCTQARHGHLKFQRSLGYNKALCPKKGGGGGDLGKNKKTTDITLASMSVYPNTFTTQVPPETDYFHQGPLQSPHLRMTEAKTQV